MEIRKPNPKSKPPLPTPPSNGGRQAYYGNPMMGGMYPGMGMGMGMGMPYGMGGMGMMGPYGGMMGGGYGFPRYGQGLYGGYGGYGYPGMVDPMMGQYGLRTLSTTFQMLIDTYGMGMGMMGGGMGINSMPGAQVMLYGRGMPYNGWYA
ncbi:hypothetical protein I317_05482 [Kwoniella heveanensis CBS 569]|nr:hypothetical protein I317_05482 [Kwoniella heveanensis CBS 569]